jgi:hypothetical protein
MSFNSYSTTTATAYNKMQAEAPRDRKDFESKYEARITDSKEYRQYVKRMPYNMWDGKVPFDAEVQVVPMKAIHLTSDNLERLVREQERMEHLENDAEFGKKLWAQERRDSAVREANPSVEKAYQKYVMLLELARK